MRNRFSALLTGPRKLALADSTVGVAVGALTASGALLIEDLLPKPGEQLQLSETRWWAFVGVVSLTLLGLLLRWVVRRGAGTLLSLQALDEGMGDMTIGRESRELARSRAMSVHAVHRWADLPGSTRDDVIDVASLVAEVGRSAELCFNTARNDERITVAPNMLWPIALSVGSRLPLAEFNTWLAEISTEDNRRNEVFRLDTKNLRSPAPLSIEPVELEEPTGERVGVSLNFTQYEPEKRLDALLPFGIREVYHLRRPSGMGKRIEGKGPSQCHFSGKELKKLSQDVAVQLARIKESAGERELVVTARLPKTMAVAIGWYLAQFKCRFYRGTHLLLYTPNEPMRPMRVRDTQCAGDEQPIPREKLDER